MKFDGDKLLGSYQHTSGSSLITFKVPKVWISDKSTLEVHFHKPSGPSQKWKASRCPDLAGEIIEKKLVP